jgi:hypothetical protein
MKKRRSDAYTLKVPAAEHAYSSALFIFVDVETQCSWRKPEEPGKIARRNPFEGEDYRAHT